jgi:eukaryotic-like serine/threonine-protein kinase
VRLPAPKSIPVSSFCSFLICSSSALIRVLGNAYLAAHRGRGASDEFQKILQHPGVLCNDLLFTVSRLGLARAYAMEADTPKAKAAYQDFLTLWKDADPDIPILKQAKAEYAKLQ